MPHSFYKVGGVYKPMEKQPSKFSPHCSTITISVCPAYIHISHNSCKMSIIFFECIVVLFKFYCINVHIVLYNSSLSFSPTLVEGFLPMLFGYAKDDIFLCASDNTMLPTMWIFFNNGSVKIIICFVFVNNNRIGTNVSQNLKNFYHC